jgi:predicted Zn-dependent peptidase
MRPALRNEDFDIEKNVIKEEIAMYEDLPHYNVMERCRGLHFDTHPCGNSVLGSGESISNLTAEQMRDYFTRRYAPNNMVAAFAGNFDWEQVCSIVESSCEKWQKQLARRKLEDSPGSKKRERIEKSNLSREHICLMSQAVPVQDNRRFAAALLAAIIGDDVGSRFFWELVDKALAEEATMQFAAFDGTGVFCSYISCSSENVGKVLDTIKSIFDELSKSSVTENEMKTAKNKILSALVIKNELPMGRLIDLGANWIYLRQYRTIEDDINAIKAVTADDVYSLIEQFNPGDFTQFSIGPAHNSQSSGQ